MSRYEATPGTATLLQTKAKPIREFRKEHTNDRQLNAIQDNVERITIAIDRRVQQLSSLSILNGELYSLEFTGAGSLIIYHGLKREPIGVIDTLPTPTAATIWISAMDDKTVTIDSGAAVDLKVWVF